MTTLDVAFWFPDGSGGARDGGRTLRIPGVLPGERVTVDAPTGKGVVTAPVARIDAPSPDRRRPPCAHDARCGGCDLSFVDPAARRRHLAAAISRLIEHDVDVVPSPRTDARARITLGVDGGRVGYRAASSHDLVEVDVCGIARPEVNAALARLRALGAEALRAVGRVEIRSDGARAIYAFDAGDAAALAPLGDVAIGGRAAHGDPTLWVDNAAARLRASPTAFYQVNLEINRQLVAFVRGHASGARKVLDLYAGIGNFALPIAADGASVTAVELAATAVSDLRAGAAAAGVEARTKPIVADADRFDPTREFADVVVLDPPRRGCPEVATRLLVSKPPKIVLIACDPRSGARELATWRRGGYRLTDARAFEMFPETHHLELALVLER